MNDIERAIETINNFIKVWELEQADEEMQMIIYKKDIEAFKIAISALEKQLPKKPFEYSYDESDGEDWYDEGYTYSCPICLNDGSEVGRYSKESEQWIFEMKEYCDNCGQRLEMK